MKKLISIIAILAALMIASSCEDNSEGFYFTPSSMTLKVGETQHFTITKTGQLAKQEGKIEIFVTEGKENIDVDGLYVRGLKAGNAVVTAGFFPTGSTKTTHAANLKVTVVN